MDILSTYETRDSLISQREGRGKSSVEYQCLFLIFCFALYFWPGSGPSCTFFWSLASSSLKGDLLYMFSFHDLNKGFVILHKEK